MLRAAAWPSRSLVQTTSGAAPAIGARSAAPGRQAGRLHGPRVVRHDDDLGAVGRSCSQAGEHPRDVVRPVVGDQLDGEAGGRRLVEDGRHGGGGTVADDLPVLDRRGRGRLEGEAGPVVDHLPAGGLELGAQGVGAGPVMGGTGLRALARDGDDLRGRLVRGGWSPAECSRDEREDDADPRAARSEVLGDGVAAVSPDELANDREAEAGSRPGARGIAAEGPLEDVGKGSRREARAVVGNREDDRGAPVRPATPRERPGSAGRCRRARGRAGRSRRGCRRSARAPCGPRRSRVRRRPPPTSRCRPDRPGRRSGPPRHAGCRRVTAPRGAAPARPARRRCRARRRAAPGGPSRRRSCGPPASRPRPGPCRPPAPRRSRRSR